MPETSERPPPLNYNKPLRVLTAEGFPGVVQATEPWSQQRRTAGRQGVAPWRPGEVLSAGDRAGTSPFMSSPCLLAGTIPDAVTASSRTHSLLWELSPLGPLATGRAELPEVTVLGSRTQAGPVPAGGQRLSSLAE